MKLRPFTGLAALTLMPALAACSSDGKSDASSSVTVNAGDSTCDVTRTALDAGTTTFAVKNAGSKVTEVYVYGQQGEKFSKVISEVENIGPGTSREMKVNLTAGTYEIACKPGQTGNGIRTKIAVGGTAAGTTSPAEVKYDREIELSTDGTAIAGLSGGATKGETVEFKLENKAGAERTLEIKSPSGDVAAEVEDIEPGKDGELIVELHTAGTWQIIVEGKGVSDVVTDLVVS